MRFAVLACAIAALGTFGCDRNRPLEVEKRRLARMPSTWRRPSIHMAEDGAHVTYAVRVRGGYYVATPAGRGNTWVDVSLPLFAPESTRVFYWGTRQEDGRKHYDVVADGTVVPTPFLAQGELVASRGGRRWAARGTVADGTSAAPRTAIVVDGRELGRFAAASHPEFSADGTHVAWLTQEESGRTAIVVDGTPVRTFDATPPSPDGPRFDQLASVDYLSDGRLVALVPEGDGWSVYRDAERLATYGYNVTPGTILVAGPEAKAGVVAPSLVTASDAPVVVWFERMPGAEERWRLMRDGTPVDGIECARYWETQPPVVSDDGTHVAYVCPTPTESGVPLGRRWVVLDGRRFGPYTETWTLGLARDGAQVAYGGAETLPILTWRVFVNGVPRTSPQELVWRPAFSPDGTHLVWAGGPERGRRRIAIDGRTVTRFNDVLAGPDFPTPRTVVWAIRRGRTISRIEARL